MTGKKTALAAGRVPLTSRREGSIHEYALVERLTVMENVLSGRLGYVGFWRRFAQSDAGGAFYLPDRVGLRVMARGNVPAWPQVGLILPLIPPVILVAVVIGEWVSAKTGGAII